MQKQSLPLSTDQQGVAGAILAFVTAVDGRPIDAASFLKAKGDCWANLSSVMHAVESMSLEQFRKLQHAAQLEATASLDSPVQDFLDGTDEDPLVFTRDGRTIRGTVEENTATGRVRWFKRNPDGTISYDFHDRAFEDEGDFETATCENGRPMFYDKEGLRVLEKDIVLVSPSRVDEFLATFPKKS